MTWGTAFMFSQLPVPLAMSYTSRRDAYFLPTCCLPSSILQVALWRGGRCSFWEHKAKLNITQLLTACNIWQIKKINATRKINFLKRRDKGAAWRVTNSFWKDEVFGEEQRAILLLGTSSPWKGDPLATQSCITSCVCTQMEVDLSFNYRLLWLVVFSFFLLEEYFTHWVAEAVGPVL